MSQILNLFGENFERMKRSCETDINLCNLIESVAVTIDGALQNHQERINALEQSQANFDPSKFDDERFSNLEKQYRFVNNKFNDVQEKIRAIENKSVNEDSTKDFVSKSYFNDALDKIESLERIVNNLDEIKVNDILNNYGQDRTRGEIKESIFKRKTVPPESPLGLAFRECICQNDFRSVEFLYPFVKTNEKYKDGKTALKIAFDNGFQEIAKFLIDNGSTFSPNAKDLENAPQCMKQLLEEMKAKSKPARYQPNIVNAASTNDLQSLKYNIQFCGGNKNASDGYSRTCLICACINGCYDTAKYLIELGANLESKDNASFTALHRACFNGNVEVVKLLVEAGANKEAKTSTERTPLHCACQEGNLAAAQYLIKCGANLKAKDRNNSTPHDVAKFTIKDKIPYK